jgi:hypothetical protein
MFKILLEKWDNRKKVFLDTYRGFLVAEKTQDSRMANYYELGIFLSS